MIVAMVIVPTLLGLVLAAVLFDLVGKKFGGKLASFLRATYYLPQILPARVAGIVIGWILRPAERRAQRRSSRRSASARSPTTGSAAPTRRCVSIMVVLIWVQIGYPVVIFMAALQRVDPELYEAAELDGADWLHRFRAITVQHIRPEIFVVTLTCTIAALKVFGPIYVLTRGGPGTLDHRAQLLLVQRVLPEPAGRLRRDDRHRADHRDRRSSSIIFIRAQNARGAQGEERV